MALSKTCFVMLVLSSIIVKECISARRKAQGKIRYEFNFSGEYKGCADEGANVFNYSNIVIIADSPTTTLMGGSFSLSQTLNLGTKITYDVFKLTETGKESSWNLEILDICNYISQENMPWSAAIDAMKLENRNCPLPARNYPLDDPIRLDMSAISSALSKDSVGEYEVLLNIKRMEGLPPRDVILSCFTCGYKIEEIREQE